MNRVHCIIEEVCRQIFWSSNFRGYFVKACNFFFNTASGSSSDILDRLFLFSQQETPSLKMSSSSSSSSFLTELFYPDHWSLRFFRSESVEARCWSNYRFIRLAPRPLCCIPWFSFLYTCVAHKILSSLKYLFVTNRGRISEWLCRCEQKRAFLKAKIHTSHRSLICYMWYYLIILFSHNA